MKTDREFMFALAESYQRVVWVATEIVMRNPEFRVEAPIVIQRPRSLHDGAYYDKGDLKVMRGDKALRFEVKGRPSLDLRNFPYKTVFLGETYKTSDDIVGIFVVGKDRYPIWLFCRNDSWKKEITYSGPDKRETESWTCEPSSAIVWDVLTK